MLKYFKLTLLGMATLFTVDVSAEEALTKPRIMDLLPDTYVYSMAIEPAIPDNFVLMVPP